MLMLLFYMRRPVAAFTGIVLLSALWQPGILASVAAAVMLCAVLLLAAAFIIVKRANHTRGRWKNRETEFLVLDKALRSKSDEVSALIEELTAANEELTAANEELSSTNEELVTTNDRLQ